MLLIKIGLILIPLLILAFFVYGSKDDYKKDNKTNYNYLIQGLLLFVLTTVLSYYFLMKIPFIQNAMDDVFIVFFNRYAVLLMACSLSAVIDCPIVICIDFFIEKKKIKKLELQKKVDYFDYYRELIVNISPAILAYIYDSKSNVEDEITATLINMEHKGIIKMEDNKIVKVEETDKLKKHENYLIKIMTNSKKIEPEDLHKAFTYQLRKDILADGLAIISEDEKLSLTEVLKLLSGWLMVSQLFLLTAIFWISSFGTSLFFSYFLCFIPMIVIDSFRKRIRPIIRTDKGIELKAKLNGLKNFLTDFTNINEKSIQEIKMYDEYILYATIFDLKGNIDDESKTIYDGIEEKKKKRKKFYVPKKERIAFILEVLFVLLFHYITLVNISPIMDDNFLVGLIVMLMPFPFTIAVINQFITKE